MLLDNLLIKADKISMAHSLEVRVPFLARELVEFGLALPPRFKVGPMRDKRLMRRLLRPMLGVRLAHRPKRGFEIPVDRWFREPRPSGLRKQLTQGALVRDLGFNSRAISAAHRPAPVGRGHRPQAVRAGGPGALGRAVRLIHRSTRQRARSTPDAQGGRARLEHDAPGRRPRAPSPPPASGRASRRPQLVARRRPDRPGARDRP